MKITQKSHFLHCKLSENSELFLQYLFVMCELFKELKMRKISSKRRNKQTFGLPGKIEISEKTRQNTENKQTFGLTGKNEINEKKNSPKP